MNTTRRVFRRGKPRFMAVFPLPSLSNMIRDISFLESISWNIKMHLIPNYLALENKRKIQQTRGRETLSNKNFKILSYKYEIRDKSLMPYFLQVTNVPLIFKVSLVIYCCSSVSRYFDQLVTTRLEFYQSVEINDELIIESNACCLFLWNHVRVNLELIVISKIIIIIENVIEILQLFC